ncbi:receptor-transporting protein 3-like [Cyprinodon tularosa]|uniref:Receptor-transporting protein 3-like n=1 Tax=Cyprinodon variegatus TaxID=28743 RepID=A0A3Q2D100_CYPVA|nr:PREDICTED: receptor-transporting protein 3-like [Cyprinodon variegatus]XP_038147547.1 receptor-transporting protein 3-like [Cyprinodon tularosa]
MNQQDWTRIFDDQIAILSGKGDTWNLVFDESIEPNNPDYGWTKYFRKTTARFSCTSCRRTWPSNRVMVIFHMRLMGGQGTVKVRPARQECKRCTSAAMVKPLVEPENIRILMENLVQKVRRNCYHEDIGEPNRRSNSLDVKSPHEPKHCEGCRLGICTRD